jgi:hypothetical protein
MKKYFTFSEGEKKYIEESETGGESFLSEYATKSLQAVYPAAQHADILRPPFARDADRILHCPLYNRYADKTQVLSFYKNDNISRRGLHVQLVSKIGRTIGRALRLNLDLIDAIALGHDIGHTPFGHKGEEYLSKAYCDGCVKRGRGPRYFNHNVQSARYFRRLTKNYDLSLQTLSGILAHNGEKVCREYSPSKLSDFKEFDDMLEKCFTDNGYHKTLRPNTLEGCVVRLSDMIAYVGKDRQDLYYAGMGNKVAEFTQTILGDSNAKIITNMVKNIVRNSINSPALNIDEEVFEEFKMLVADNYDKIYRDKKVVENYNIVEGLMPKLYEALCADVLAGDQTSFIYRHHIKGMHLSEIYKEMGIPGHADDIVADYIASMTDDYFIDLCQVMRIDDGLTSGIKYRGYFD